MKMIKKVLNFILIAIFAGKSLVFGAVDKPMLRAPMHFNKTMEEFIKARNKSNLDNYSIQWKDAWGVPSQEAIDIAKRYMKIWSSLDLEKIGHKPGVLFNNTIIAFGMNPRSTEVSDIFMAICKLCIDSGNFDFPSALLLTPEVDSYEAIEHILLVDYNKPYVAEAINRGVQLSKQNSDIKVLNRTLKNVAYNGLDFIHVYQELPLEAKKELLGSLDDESVGYIINNLYLYLFERELSSRKSISYEERAYFYKNIVSNNQKVESFLTPDTLLWIKSSLTDKRFMPGAEQDAELLNILQGKDPRFIAATGVIIPKGAKERGLQRKDGFAAVPENWKPAVFNNRTEHSNYFLSLLFRETLSMAGKYSDELGYPVIARVMIYGSALVGQSDKNSDMDAAFQFYSYKDEDLKPMKDAGRTIQQDIYNNISQKQKKIEFILIDNDIKILTSRPYQIFYIVSSKGTDYEKVVKKIKDNEALLEAALIGNFRALDLLNNDSVRNSL